MSQYGEHMAKATTDKDPIQAKLEELRREQILEAAVKVFAEKGFRAAKMQEVANTAGISNGTVYNYFRSKDEVLLALLERLNETEARPAQFEELKNADLQTVFLTQMRHRFDFMMTQRDVMRGVLPEIISNPEVRSLYFDKVVLPTLKMGEAAFDNVLPKGKKRKVAPEHLVRAMAGSLFGLVLLNLMGDDETEEDSQDILTFLSQCFATALS
jgi:AcrR family transcriptional regulator